MNSQSWHERMDDDMVIAGLSERTREAYLRAVRQLSKFHSGGDPETLSEQHVKDYLLRMRNEKRAAPRHTQDCLGCYSFLLPPHLYPRMGDAAEDRP